MSKDALPTEPYKGVRDFYPEDWAQLQAVFSVLRNELLLNGFEEYNASPLERAELYESKTSEEIVNEQTYTFTDRGDRRVTLRPEMTPTLARMIAAKGRELAYPVRWFSIGNRFRYERPQKGRLREFYQTDVDIVGIPDAKAEGEAVVIASKLLRAFGAADADFSIRINSRALLNAACAACGLEDADLGGYLAVLDRKSKMDADAFEAARAPFRRDGRDPLEVIEQGDHALVREEKEKIEVLLAAFEERGMNNVRFDPTVVRGFLYYTGLVFEVYDTDLENPRALMGGGRYDNLVSLFGGAPVPAVGFALGDVTLVDFLRTHDLLPRTRTGADLYIGTPGTESIQSAQIFADALRAQGVRTLVNVSDKALGDQIKDAVKRGIPYFIAYGEKEIGAQEFVLKALQESREETIPLDAIAARIVAKSV